MCGWSRCEDPGKRSASTLLGHTTYSLSAVLWNLPSTPLVAGAFPGLLSHGYTGLKALSLLGLLRLALCM